MSSVNCGAMPAGRLSMLGLAVIAALALATPPASAQYGYWAAPLGAWHRPARRTAARKEATHKEASSDSKEPFGNMPKGPVQIVISINQQKLHLYSDGMHVADTSIATGVPSLPTPLGLFSVIQKQVFHRSNIYSNAPMPFMQRITWSGVALHEGENIGHPASHGCVRMPRDFAIRLYHVTRLGVPVIIARPELKPADIADPRLFVHREPPPTPPAPPPVAAAPAVSAVAEVTTPAAPSLAQPADIGLRVSDAQAPKADPPPPQPPDIIKAAVAKKMPIAIFISRKEKKIFVRQDFAPLFDAAVSITDPAKPLGTHLFTALAFTGDDHATLRWDVVSMPGEPPAKVLRKTESEPRYGRHVRQRREEDQRLSDNPPPPQTPAEALARIDIPQDVIDRIAQLIIPGSTLIVSDQGLGETGEGTNFVVVMQ